MKIKIVLLTAFLLTLGSTGFAQSKTTAIAPDAVVRNLYAAQKNEKNSPFFQAKSRALVDKYFAKELANLIWKDAKAVDASGGLGSLDFDPLYNAQDTEITGFKIGKPMYGEGNLQLADVPVDFKNMGKKQTILFRLEQGADKRWKISDIYYPDNTEPHTSLTKIISYAPSEENAESKQKQVRVKPSPRKP